MLNIYNGGDLRLEINYLFTKIFLIDHITSISSLKKEHLDYIEQLQVKEENRILLDHFKKYRSFHNPFNFFFLKKQHENEIYDLKSDYSIKVLSLEDKIDKLNKEIETNKKLIASLGKEIAELKVIFLLSFLLEN
jgi:hypothetical protein